MDFRPPKFAISWRGFYREGRSLQNKGMALSWETRLLAVLVLISSSRALAQARDELGALIGSIEFSNVQVPRIKPGACPPTTPKRPFGSSTIKDVKGKDLKISVIPEERLSEIRDLVRSPLRLMDADVCVQRAHVVGEELGKTGVETAKIFVEPSGGGHLIYPDDNAKFSTKTPVGWKVHVASVFLVQKKDGRVEQYVFDPVLSTRPLPRSEWEGRLRSNPRSSVASMSITSRYVMNPSDKYEDKTSYSPKEIRRAHEVMDGSPLDRSGS